MDEEAQAASFYSDGEIGPFFDALNGEDTVEVYEEEVLPAGVVPEDETAAVGKTPL